MSTEQITYNYINSLEEFQECLDNKIKNYNNIIFSDNFEFRNIDMINFTFNNAVANGSKFINCKMDGATFINANLFYTEITHTSAKCTNFDNAVMSNSKLTRCNFTEATFINTAMTNAKYSSIKNNKLSGSTLDNAVISPRCLELAELEPFISKDLMLVVLVVIGMFALCLIQGIL